MLTAMCVIGIILLVLMAPFIGLGMFFETSTGQSVYDGINWVLGGGWFVIIFGGIVWLGCLCGMLFQPFSLLEGQSTERKYNHSNFELFFSFIITTVLTILAALLGRWVWPFGWSRKVVMWVMIISIVLQGIVTLLGMNANKKPANPVSATIPPSVAIIDTTMASTTEKKETPKLRVD
ncbi:hypothetical protein [Bifidobacterium callitrichidarum]|uniref:Uncharacterized protein n=1 Tax=Bifidobacterium callitrichidarum TaxID=2052941 RepID=A0A2U2NC72_9BIFI|nr:hypothetical protein [Bifidobacterium callitrichidarum]PWG66703.1 hypothetical protein DF196_02020 [Bifidobacterium callitrichidarum]